MYNIISINNGIYNYVSKRNLFEAKAELISNPLIDDI